MSRITEPERVRRLNAAIELLNERGSPGEAASALADQYGLSIRQSYRYIREAQRAPHPVPVPESKVAFTVKIPKNLLQELREFTASSGRSIGEVVSEALEKFLRRGKRRGRR